MKKRVMVVIPALGCGGAERLAVSLISKMDQTRFETKLVVLYPYQDTDNSKFVERHGIDVVYLNKHRGVDFSIIHKLRKEIKIFKPDVIQTHLYVISYVLLASSLKIKKYHTVHNVAEKESFGVRRIISKIAFKFGNFVPVAISPYCAETISNLYHIKRKDIPCINNGVNIDKYFPMPINHADIVLISVGRLQEQKNHKMLLNVFGKVHKKYPAVKLRIYGEGELRGELEEKIKKLGLEQVVEMPGQCTDIAKQLNRSDIFVQSSDYEGLPISGLEAMACGLPIISTKAGGTIDIVEEGINGFLVDIGDEDKFEEYIELLVEDDKKRKFMGEMSRCKAEKFSIDNCVRQYEKLYFQKNSK